jgi:hypothetical protein
MPDCDILDENGKPIDLQNGDIMTSDGGLMGLGHAGVVRKRNGKVEVIEVLDTPEGDVHVQVNDLCDFVERYLAQKRNVFVSRPKQPTNVTPKEWEQKLDEAVKDIESKVCNRYPVWAFVLNALWDQPDIWYCSEIIWEAFRKQGIDLSANISFEDSSSDPEARAFLRMLRRELVCRLGAERAEAFISGFTLPESNFELVANLGELIDQRHVPRVIQIIDRAVTDAIRRAEQVVQEVQ